MGVAGKDLPLSTPIQLRPFEGVRKRGELCPGFTRARPQSMPAIMHLQPKSWPASKIEEVFWVGLRSLSLAITQRRSKQLSKLVKSRFKETVLSAIGFSSGPRLRPLPVRYHTERRRFGSVKPRTRIDDVHISSIYRRAMLKNAQLVSTSFLKPTPRNCLRNWIRCAGQS